MSPATEETQILFTETPCREQKKIATITLNRPKRLNALSLEMITTMQDQLDVWEKDTNIVAVIIKAAGDKAFCAGGDIQAMYHSMMESQQTTATKAPLTEVLFAHEYRLNYGLITYAKPIITMGHGIIMGGGWGIFNGGTFRVVTETSTLAMPEICIGLYPDVGASQFFNALPHNIGRFLALTGSSINASDSLYLGLANTFIASEDLVECVSQLHQQTYSDSVNDNTETIHNVFKAFEKPSASKKPQAVVTEHEKYISNKFSEEDTCKLLTTFLSENFTHNWLVKAQQNVQYGSPLSALLIDEQLKRSQSYNLIQVFESELILSTQITRHSEFTEGVRALLIDKDRKPNWQYNHYSSIPKSVINNFFVPPWETNPLFINHSQ